MAFSLEVDTAFFANGGPGPYSLGTYFIDTASIFVSFTTKEKDSTLTISQPNEYVPAFTFISELNAILFSEPIDRKTKIRVKFKAYDFGIPRIYSAYEKKFAGIKDSIILLRDSVKFISNQSNYAEENLNVSGYKSINVSLSNLAGVNLEQALDVTISGEIAKNTVLSGHLTDQGTNIEGTRELSDFERVYLELVNPKYVVSVGDQYIDWPIYNGIFFGTKKIKGIYAGIRDTVNDSNKKNKFLYSVNGYGAICAGKFTVQTLRAKAGIQGPYYLTGQGEAGFITPIRGTVCVYVNGIKCLEGAENHYTVDYELGTFSFTPKILIKENDIIRVEYEYRIFDYQRILSGCGVKVFLPDSSLRVNGGIWYETDDKNHPIENAITSQDMQILAMAGDNPSMHSTKREVLPVDVPSLSTRMPLYKKDSLGNYFFAKYDPQKPQDVFGYYAVWFKEVGQTKGAYVVDTLAMSLNSQYSDKIYKYVGEGLGYATDSSFIPLPSSNVSGEIKASYKPLKWIDINANIAGLSIDKNVASKKDDEDNNGSASNIGITLGRKTEQERSAWLYANNQYITPNFTKEALKTYESYSLWDDTTSNIRLGLRHLWHTEIGATLFPKTLFMLDYGQFRHNSLIKTDRFSGNVQLLLFDNYMLDYKSQYFRHLLLESSTSRNDFSLSTRLFSTNFSIKAKDEWRKYKEGNRGEYGGGISAFFDYLSLNEDIFCLFHKKGNAGILNSSDTGITLTWNQSVSKQILPIWKVDLTSNYLYQNLFDKEKFYSTLVNAESDIFLLEHGFSSHQNYRVNIEKASTYVQTPIYAQPGRGNYVWSDSLKEYVYKENGDYYLIQKEIYDSTSNKKVRKSRFLVNWSYSPKKEKGINLLRDLSWYGSLNLEEYLSLSVKQPYLSWLVGYVSLITKEGLKDTSLTLSDIFYRQNIEWNFKEYSSHIFLQPFAKKIRGYYETGIEGGINLDRIKDPWSFEVELNWLYSNRTEKTGINKYKIEDRSASAKQRYLFASFLGLYIKETAGWAMQNSVFESNKGWYYKIVPGLDLRISNRGSAEASYTYSYVGINNIIDPRIAQGFASGVSHCISLSGHADFSNHFAMDISYRGELGRNYFNSTGLHVFSMQVKAYL